MKTFKKLKKDEKALLVKAPALVSFLAVDRDNTTYKTEQAEALKLSHIRTFTSDPLLTDYYKEVEKFFESQWNKLNQKYSPLNKANRKTIEQEIARINKLLDRMDPKFADALRESLHSYAEHVGKADQNLLKYFVLPVNIEGIGD